MLSKIGNGLSSAKNRLVVGLILVGLGGSLIASAYIRVED